VTNAALIALGLAPEDAGFDVPLPPALPIAFPEKLRADAHWARTYVVPGVERRVRHTSSGDGRSAKWPDLVRWPPAGVPGGE
jgi:hypothetical protein